LFGLPFILVAVALAIYTLGLLSAVTTFACSYLAQEKITWQDDVEIKKTKCEQDWKGLEKAQACLQYLSLLEKKEEKYGKKFNFYKKWIIGLLIASILLFTAGTMISSTALFLQNRAIGKLMQKPHAHLLKTKPTIEKQIAKLKLEKKLIRIGSDKTGF